jgi:hypothetical protein
MLARLIRPAQWMAANADARLDRVVTVSSMTWPHADGELRVTVRKSAALAPGDSGTPEQMAVVPVMLQFQPPTWPERTRLTLRGSEMAAVMGPVGR